MSLPAVLAEPFPHLVTDGLWDDGLLDKVLAEVPSLDDPRWRRYAGEHEEGKLEGSDPALWGDATRALLANLASEPWRQHLGSMFGIPQLSADTTGGGYHQIVTGGRLAMHVDFNRGVGTRLHRRLNCLVYLNKGYVPAWGGALCLGRERQVVIEPAFNRTVIFATSEHSWHGHPDPWAGPAPRRSVAIYYYSPEPAEEAPDHSTVWMAP